MMEQTTEGLVKDFAVDGHASMDHSGMVSSNDFCTALLFLRICSILPWTPVIDYFEETQQPFWRRPSAWYRAMVLVLACSSCIFTALAVMTEDVQDSGLLSDFAIAFGSVLGLFATRYRE